jgi:hypothetical protein
MQVIEITSLTGHSPYNISICDITLTYCYVVATGVVSVPPTLQLTVPSQLEGDNQVLVVVTDSIGCEEFLLVSCPGTPTPTPTLTPTTPCGRECCYVELCYSTIDCADACQCNQAVGVYLDICKFTPCRLSSAFGIYSDDTCTIPSADGYYSNTVDCYYWDGSTLTLTYQGPC